MDEARAASAMDIGDFAVTVGGKRRPLKTSAKPCRFGLSVFRPIGQRDSRQREVGRVDGVRPQ